MRRGTRRVRVPAVVAAMVLALGVTGSGWAADEGDYPALLGLFEEWRDFERPAMSEGAPDYSAAAVEERHRGLRELQSRLEAIDPSGWPVEQQVDYHLVRAEMNGLDFNIRVLKPWARDPAYYQSVWTYQSDTPAHEGPTHHALVELWTYEFPLSAEGASRLAGELATIPPLLTQARRNLVGEARELWISGIGNLRDQEAVLSGLEEEAAAAGGDLPEALDRARQATASFIEWLEQQSESKTAPSGIGKENYTWYLQNVHLVPLTWEDEVRLLKRELDRAHASLRLEEHRNQRSCRELVAISSPEEYETTRQRGRHQVPGFPRAARTILPIRDYMDPGVARPRSVRYVPARVAQLLRVPAIHFEPMTLWTHFYHWWDLARMETDPHPSPVRRDPLLYNIFDSRAEGMATGVEEMMMHTGLYDDNPRAREIVWIMLAQRAARGLGSLYVHSNDFTMKEARDFHVAWTPRGWMREDLDLLGFEQQLYLRQPGYGSSYVTGKYLIERLLADRSRQMGEDFSLSDFYAEVDAAGVIPVSLIRWQLTGHDDDVRRLPGMPPDGD